MNSSAVPRDFFEPPMDDGCAIIDNISLQVNYARHACYNYFVFIYLQIAYYFEILHFFFDTLLVVGSFASSPSHLWTAPYA